MLRVLKHGILPFVFEDGRSSAVNNEAEKEI